MYNIAYWQNPQSLNYKPNTYSRLYKVRSHNTYKRAWDDPLEKIRTKYATKFVHLRFSFRKNRD